MSCNISDHAQNLQEDYKFAAVFLKKRKEKKRNNSKVFSLKDMVSKDESKTILKSVLYF